MSSELIVLGIVLLLLCAGFVFLFLRAFYRKSFVMALVFKGLASLCFVVFGGVNCFCGEFSYTKLIIFIGLCFGIFGDEIIALCQIFPERDTLAFVGGGAFFIVGHAFYIIALFLIGVPSWVALAVAFLLFVALSLLYARFRGFLSGEMRVPLALYLMVVVFVAALAVGAFFSRVSVGAALFALGGVFFAVSDNILFAYKKGENPKFFQNILLHVAYYLAQSAIAWSISLL